MLYLESVAEMATIVQHDNYMVHYITRLFSMYYIKMSRVKVVMKNLYNEGERLKIFI